MAAGGRDLLRIEAQPRVFILKKIYSLYSVKVKSNSGWILWRRWCIRLHSPMFLHIWGAWCTIWSASVYQYIVLLYIVTARFALRWVAHTQQRGKTIYARWLSSRKVTSTNHTDKRSVSEKTRRWLSIRFNSVYVSQLTFKLCTMSRARGLTRNWMNFVCVEDMWWN